PARTRRTRVRPRPRSATGPGAGVQASWIQGPEFSTPSPRGVMDRSMTGRTIGVRHATLRSTNSLLQEFISSMAPRAVLLLLSALMTPVAGTAQGVGGRGLPSDSVSRGDTLPTFLIEGIQVMGGRGVATPGG